MNRELDVRIAEEFFGWTRERANKRTILRNKHDAIIKWDDEMEWRGDDLAHFSVSHEACWGLEEKIKEMGLMREYGLSLARELGLFDDEREMDDWEGKDVFAIAHASPEIRCIAALEMMATRASKSDPTQG